jgi:membrane protease subunit HflK
MVEINHGGELAMAARIYRAGDFNSGDVPWEQIVRIVPMLVAVGLVLLLAWKSFYTVKPHEQAVVLRFGKQHAIRGPGLHFMVPLVDRPVRVSIAEQRLRLPVDHEPEARGPGRLGGGQEEALELTGDLNAAVVEWTVNWQVHEPDKFLFCFDQRHIETTIEVVARSVMHRLVGDYSMDEILTSKREEVGLQARDATQRMLESYHCGIQVTGLQMQRVTPPDQVKPAFDEVNAAIQKRDKLVNEANRERNQLIPQAQARADRLINEAAGYADRRRAEAQGEIAALLAKFRAYQEAPDMTRRRLYLEAMEEVLTSTGPKTVVDADLRGLVPLLQLGSDAPAAPGRVRKESQ